MSNTTEIPDRSDRRAFELYRHSIEMANLEGKELERLDRDARDAKWVSRGDSRGCQLDWSRYDYRLAPEAPKVAPWTFETVPVGAVVKVKSGVSIRALITEASKAAVRLGGPWYPYEDVLDNFEQLDGSPCGTVQQSDWPRYWHNSDRNLVVRFQEDGSNSARFVSRPDEWEKTNYEANSIGKGSSWGTWRQITPAEAQALIRKAKSA